MNIPIEICGIAFVPGHIICGFCNVDPKLIDIANKVPHITMKVGDWSAFMSNKVLEYLFVNNDSPLKKEFEEGKLILENKDDPIINKLENAAIH